MYGFCKEFEYEKKEDKKPAANLMRQRKEGKYCDVCILVDEKRFLAHKTILSANSSKFDGIIMEAIQGSGGNRDVEIDMQGFSAVGFEPLLGYFYSGNLELQSDTVMEIQLTAGYLDLPDVVKKCSEFCRDSVTCVVMHAGDSSGKGCRVSSSSNEVSLTRTEEDKENDVETSQRRTLSRTQIGQLKIPETRIITRSARKTAKRKSKSNEVSSLKEPATRVGGLSCGSPTLKRSKNSSKKPSPKVRVKNREPPSKARENSKPTDVLVRLEALEIFGSSEASWEKESMIESTSKKAPPTLRDPSIAEECDGRTAEVDVVPNFEDVVLEPVSDGEFPASDDSFTAKSTPKKKKHSALTKKKSSPTNKASNSPSTKSKKSIMFQKYSQPAIFGGKYYSTSEAISYPGSIPYPFPLSPHFKEYLKEVSKPNFCENYALYKSIVREIHSNVVVRLGRAPSNQERKQIAVGLVREYPVVGSGYPPHSALNVALYKRAHNQTVQLKNQLLENSSSTPANTPQRKKHKSRSSKYF